MLTLFDQRARLKVEEVFDDQVALEDRVFRKGDAVQQCEDGLGAWFCEPAIGPLLGFRLWSDDVQRGLGADVHHRIRPGDGIADPLVIENIAHRLSRKIDQERVVGDGVDAGLGHDSSARPPNQLFDLVSPARCFGLGPEHELDLEADAGIRVDSLDAFGDAGTLCLAEPILRAPRPEIPKEFK